MNLKKSISMLLCMTAVAGITAGLSGCGKEKEAASGGELLWCMFGEKPQDYDAVMEKVNEIVEPKLGVKLKIDYIDSAAYTEKMKLKMASGESYDLAFSGFLNGYPEAVSLGGLYDITELLDKVGMNEVVPQYLLDAAMIDGKIYGVPNEQVISNPECIHMDKTLADKIGVDMKAISDASVNIRTKEDELSYLAMIDDLFEKIHKERPDLYVYNPMEDLISRSIYEALVSVTVDLWLPRDGSSDKFVIAPETDEWKLGVKKLNEWYQKGYIRNDIASKGNALADNTEKKQVAVRYNNWAPGCEVNLKKIYGDDQEIALLYEPYVGIGSPLATMIAVGADSKQPEKAVEFIKLINSDKELFNLICWGIEGKHYTKNEEGLVKEIENSGYNNIGPGAWKYGNQFNSFVMEGQEPDVWEKTKKMNDEADKSPMLGFAPNTDSITNELANVTNVDAEYRAKIKFGTEDIDTWYDEYMQKLKTAGIDKIRDEMQKQYDEFLASKK